MTFEEVMESFGPLLIAETVLLTIVFVALPIYAARKAGEISASDLKGLALPQGSVRSMLALAVVGTFLIFLIFGAPAVASGNDSKFTEIIAALTGISGTVIGFYFGSGGSSANQSVPKD